MIWFDFDTKSQFHCRNSMSSRTSHSIVANSRNSTSSQNGRGMSMNPNPTKSNTKKNISFASSESDDDESRASLFGDNSKT